MPYKDIEKRRESARLRAKRRYHRSIADRDMLRARAQEWRTKNPYLSTAVTHQHGVKRRNPEAYLVSDIETKDLAEWLSANRGKECRYCGQETSHIDHKIPLTRGGPHTWANIELLCVKCNQSKRDRTPEEFLAHVKLIAERCL